MGFSELELQYRFSVNDIGNKIFQFSFTSIFNINHSLHQLNPINPRQDNILLTPLIENIEYSGIPTTLIFTNIASSSMKRATMWYFFPGTNLSFHSSALTICHYIRHMAISAAAGQEVKVIRTLTTSAIVPKINPVTVFIFFRWYDDLLLARIVSPCSW